MQRDSYVKDVWKWGGKALSSSDRKPETVEELRTGSVNEGERLSERGRRLDIKSPREILNPT